MFADALALVASATTLFAIYLLGRRFALGWTVGIVGQVLWIVWAILVAPAVLPFEIICGGLYVEGWFRWRRDG